jgi:transposase InsO family protein
MAQQEHYLNQRLSVREVEQLLSNASAVYSRSNKCSSGYGIDFSELKEKFQHSGLAGLKSLAVTRAAHPHRTPPQVIDSILVVSLEHPDWGCSRISQKLKNQGISISSPTIQKILITKGMGNRNDRVLKLEAKVLAEEAPLSAEQIAFIEKANPCFRERFSPSDRPGQILAQDAILVGFLKGIGKIYLQFVIDTYNSFAFGFLHPGKRPDCGVAILHNDVLPFYRNYNLTLQTIITKQGRAYCGTEKHHYELYLTLNEITHLKTPLHDRHGNGFTEQFNQTVLREFFKKSLNAKPYDTIESLQADFDQWLHYYNHKRSHQGYPNIGASPADIYYRYFGQFPW